MSEEFNEFVERQIKNHARRTGMKTGDAHPWVRHSSRAAAFEAWENRQKVIEQQQARINKLELCLDTLCKLDEADVYVAEPWQRVFAEARQLLEKDHD